MERRRRKRTYSEQAATSETEESEPEAVEEDSKDCSVAAAGTGRVLVELGRGTDWFTDSDDEIDDEATKARKRGTGDLWNQIDVLLETTGELATEQREEAEKQAAFDRELDSMLLPPIPGTENDILDHKSKCHSTASGSQHSSSSSGYTEEGEYEDTFIDNGRSQLRGKEVLDCVKISATPFAEMRIEMDELSSFWAQKRTYVRYFTLMNACIMRLVLTPMPAELSKRKKATTTKTKKKKTTLLSTPIVAAIGSVVDASSSGRKDGRAAAISSSTGVRSGLTPKMGSLRLDDDVLMEEALADASTEKSKSESGSGSQSENENEMIRRSSDLLEFYYYKLVCREGVLAELQVGRSENHGNLPFSVCVDPMWLYNDDMALPRTEWNGSKLTLTVSLKVSAIDEDVDDSGIIGIDSSSVVREKKRKDRIDLMQSTCERVLPSVPVLSGEYSHEMAERALAATNLQWPVFWDCIDLKPNVPPPAVLKILPTATDKPPVNGSSAVDAVAIAKSALAQGESLQQSATGRKDGTGEALDLGLGDDTGDSHRLVLGLGDDTGVSHQLDLGLGDAVGDSISLGLGDDIVGVSGKDAMDIDTDDSLLRSIVGGNYAIGGTPLRRRKKKRGLISATHTQGSADLLAVSSSSDVKEDITMGSEQPAVSQDSADASAVGRSGGRPLHMPTEEITSVLVLVQQQHDDGRKITALPFDKMIGPIHNRSFTVAFDMNKKTCAGGQLHSDIVSYSFYGLPVHFAVLADFGVGLGANNGEHVSDDAALVAEYGGFAVDSGVGTDAQRRRNCGKVGIHLKCIHLDPWFKNLAVAFEMRHVESGHFRRVDLTTFFREGENDDNDGWLDFFEGSDWQPQSAAAAAATVSIGGGLYDSSGDVTMLSSATAVASNSVVVVGAAAKRRKKRRTTAVVPFTMECTVHILRVKLPKGVSFRDVFDGKIAEENKPVTWRLPLVSDFMQQTAGYSIETVVAESGIKSLFLLKKKSSTALASTTTFSSEMAMDSSEIPAKVFLKNVPVRKRKGVGGSEVRLNTRFEMVFKRISKDGDICVALSGLNEVNNRCEHIVRRAVHCVLTITVGDSMVYVQNHSMEFSGKKDYDIAFYPRYLLEAVDDSGAKNVVFTMDVYVVYVKWRERKKEKRKKKSMKRRKKMKTVGSKLQSKDVTT